jgi:C-terminal processing protease CtpA/Prc
VNVIIARSILIVLAAVLAPLLPTGETKYTKDVSYLLDQCEQEASDLLTAKHVDWKSVRKEFEKSSRDVKNDVEHVNLCARLIARLRDGHAGFTKTSVSMPEEPPQYGVGLYLAEEGGTVLVKSAFGPALASGVEAGFNVVSIDGVKAVDWVTAQAARLSDRTGFSTDHAARYAACHWSLAGPEGTKFELVFDRDTKGKKSVTLTCAKAGGVPRYIGSPFPPKDAKALGRRDSYCKLESGFAYIALGECAAELPDELDTALGTIGDSPGLILDMRANNGGATDHEAVFGRFLADEQHFEQYVGKGKCHFTGPLVVIVDAGTRSTGETVSGMLKEDGRAYMIGPGPTAGMSSMKKEITVPSGLFTVRISVGSNKSRFNKGAGIEGLGVPPHEIVAWDQKLLKDGVDPCVARAEELLKSGFPKGVVRYVAPKAKAR